LGAPVDILSFQLEIEHDAYRTLSMSALSFLPILVVLFILLHRKKCLVELTIVRKVRADFEGKLNAEDLNFFFNFIY